MPAPRDWKGRQSPAVARGDGRGAGRSWNWHSISNNDGEGYENVTKKVNSRRFKPYLAYSISFTSSNFGKCFWSWILKECIKVQEKKKKVFCLVFPSSTKREFRHLHVMVVQWRQRNVQKSVMHMQSCCFANLNLLIFCRSLWRRRHWLGIRRQQTVMCKDGTLLFWHS